MTKADEFLSNAAKEIGLHENASPGERYGKVYNFIEKLGDYNTSETIPVGTTGTITDRICGWALESVGGDFYYRPLIYYLTILATCRCSNALAMTVQSIGDAARLSPKPNSRCLTCAKFGHYLSNPPVMKSLRGRFQVQTGRRRSTAK